MSCSDKVARWALLGVQGALLSGLLSAPLYLHSVVVGAQGSPETLGDEGLRAAERSVRRAVVERVSCLTPRLAPPFAPAPPAVHAVPLAPAELRALGLAAGGERRSACGACLVWCAQASPAWRLKPAKPPLAPGAAAAAELSVLTGGASETVTGLSGCKVGRGRNGADPAPPGARPSLCKLELAGQFQEAEAALRRGGGGGNCGAGVEEGAGSYGGAKRAFGASYRAAWRRLLQAPSPFEGWIEKPAAGEDFGLPPRAPPT
jgi:hypothetical protein